MANFMMFGREARLLDALRYDPQLPDNKPVNRYQDQHLREIRRAHENVNQWQDQVQEGEEEEPLQFGVGDLVLMENRRRRKEENSKLQLPFCGPYTITTAYKNHTYKVVNPRQTTSVQNEERLKEYRVGIEAGRAPIIAEACRRPNMKGVVKRVTRSTSPHHSALPERQVAIPSLELTPMPPVEGEPPPPRQGGWERGQSNSHGSPSGP